MKNILKVVFVIIGALIGAGFASGQEIYLFFFSYGIYGIYGIIISSLIIGITIYKTLYIIHKKDITTYKEFLKEIFSCNNKLIEFINMVIQAFILITFFIMISGFGAYFEQEYKINSIIGSSLLAILCYFILNKNIKGVIKVNEILTPILITFIITIGIINVRTITFYNIREIFIKQNNLEFILKAIIYSSYNSILLIPVLITLKNYLKEKNQIIKISVISCIIIMTLSVVVFIMLTKVDINIEMLEMPVVYVISNFSEKLKYIYGTVILGAIFTTAISLGISFLENKVKGKNKNTKKYKLIVISMCILSILTSKIGFSNLIKSLYSIFGYVGIIQIIKILLF